MDKEELLQIAKKSIEEQIKYIGEEAKEVYSKLSDYEIKLLHKAYSQQYGVALWLIFDNLSSTKEILLKRCRDFENNVSCPFFKVELEGGEILLCRHPDQQIKYEECQSVQGGIDNDHCPLNKRPLLLAKMK